LKGQEQEALINELKQVKSENQKLKEKLKDVLVKYSNQNQNAIISTYENEFSIS
jgi:cell shape-determining protein MreC